MRCEHGCQALIEKLSIYVQFIPTYVYFSDKP